MEYENTPGYYIATPSQFEDMTIEAIASELISVVPGWSIDIDSPHKSQELSYFECYGLSVLGALEVIAEVLNLNINENYENKTVILRINPALTEVD